jgi:hypothetical protein
MIDFSQKDYSPFQKGAKRFEKTMEGVPDRVPVYAQMHEFAMRELDVSAKEF